MRRLAVVLLVVALGACGGRTAAFSTRTAAPTPTTSTAPAPPPTTSPPSTSRVTTPRPATTTTLALIVDVPYRIEVRTSDPSGADFPAAVDATLTDERGWERARFRLLHRDDAEYVVILAEPADAQALCQPYDVYSKYSCQNGPRVVINAERWRSATPEWTGDLATYRQMVVNHEFGHLLGQHHPRSDCPVPKRPAAVMSQQSTELNGCLPNPWPLPWEITLAARHDKPLAPPYSR